MSLDKEDIMRIAKLARLNIQTSNLESVQKDLKHIVKFIDHLSEVDTSKVDPATSTNNWDIPMRQDIINDGNYVEKILSNAPEVVADMFVVPKVVE